MAIAAPSNEVTRLVEALGLRTKNTREVTLRMAVNEVVAVNTVEFVNGEQIDALAADMKERQYRLARWIPVEERLPEHLQPVIGWHPASYRAFGEVCWNATEKRWADVDTGLVCGDVTHWMEMPEPPVPSGTTH